MCIGTFALRLARLHILWGRLGARAASFATGLCSYPDYQSLVVIAVYGI